VSGESLWVIAQRYLHDGARWPVIYEANRETIEDPDAITPGQVLVIPGAEAGGTEPPPVAGATVQLVTVTTVAAGEQRPGTLLIRPAGPPSGGVAGRPDRPGRTRFYKGSEAGPGRESEAETPPGRTTFYARETTRPTPTSGPGPSRNRWGELLPVPGGIVFGADWLEGEGEKPEDLGSLAWFARGQGGRGLGTRARIHDRIRVRIDADAGLRVGDLLQSFRVVREEEGLGTVARPTGLLSVTRVGDEAEAQLTAEFGRVRLGDRIRLAPAYEMRPGAIATPVSSNVSASVMGFPVNRPMHGIGALAFLDVGEPEGIMIGDEFQAFDERLGPSPGTESATLQVVLVHGNVSTARVIKVKRPTLGAGDRLRLVRKMY
jgi:hypothetical protein